MAIAESTHWYDLQGNPVYTVVGQNGKRRDTTLRDARKLSLVPSVTTIMGAILAKHGLTNWLIDEALKASFLITRAAGENEKDFIDRAKAESRKQTTEAAARGTEIHAQIEKGFSGGPQGVAYLAVREILDKLFPDARWIAEDSFACGLYGGKIDLYSKDHGGIFVDFKTKDGLSGVKSAASLVYDEHRMQLSAYANGKDVDDPHRVSIFIDRADPKLAIGHVHDKLTHKRDLSMFMLLAMYWHASKNYIVTDGWCEKFVNEMRS